MSTVPRVVIDPHLLCLRSACESKDAFEAFAERLVSWSGVIGSSKIQILVSERCIGSLIQSDAYPFTHTLRDAVKKFETTHISSDLLEKLAQWLLELRPYFEDAIDTEEIVVTEANTQITPERYVSRLTLEPRIAFRDTLVAAAHWSSNVDKQFEILVGSFPTTGADTQSVEVNIIAEGVFRRNGELVTYDPPKQIREELLCTFNCHNLVAAQNAVEVWDSAKTGESICKAIEFRLAEHQQSGLASEIKLKCLTLVRVDEMEKVLKDAKEENFALWTVGPRFLQSLHTWNFSQVASQAELIIDACARILLDAPREPINEFWKHVDKKIQWVRNDGATGWRTHLSKRGVGFRLMLWKHKDGTIEFANVANKAECEIF